MIQRKNECTLKQATIRSVEYIRYLAEIKMLKKCGYYSYPYAIKG